MVPISFAARCLLVALAGLLVSAVQAQFTYEDVEKMSDAMQLSGKTAACFKKYCQTRLGNPPPSDVLNFALSCPEPSGHASVRVFHNSEHDNPDTLKFTQPMSFDYKTAEGTALHILILETEANKYAMAFNDGGDSDKDVYDYAILQSDNMAEELFGKLADVPGPAVEFANHLSSKNGRIDAQLGDVPGILYLHRLQWNAKKNHDDHRFM
eukprot:GHVS01109072.1.p1 GENE.GHVS01109072.1~~GHVS01109072.1.p1  ORF type:complete len:231 (+),score=24.57 GHVS01109072.1:64-693(+)